MVKTHGGMVKFKAALAALTGKPIVDICKQYEIAESTIHKWKKQLLENGQAVFSGKSKAAQETKDNEIAKLYQRIGQLTTELEFLKKIVDA
jgi:transposase